MLKEIGGKMEYLLGVYGDSIAFGYGNDKSWFDCLDNFSPKIKMAQNGEIINNVLLKILADTNTYQTLIIAVGINNFLSDSPVNDNPEVAKKIVEYEEVLKVAKTRAKHIVVQSVLPVIENKFPNQKYLDDPRWIFNVNAVEFNKMLKPLAQKYGAQYVDAFSVFNSKNLEDLYFDGVHPNATGQNLLLEIYENELK